jgi:hypothetical protein
MHGKSIFFQTSAKALQTFNNNILQGCKFYCVGTRKVKDEEVANTYYFDCWLYQQTLE